MSRIYDAIRIARESRSSNDSLGAMELPDRRLSARLDLNVGLMVYGRSSSDTVFYEPGKAITGNANGGVFLMSVPIEEGQDLLLVNNRTSEEQVCIVVGVRIRDIQTSEVSVSFPAPNENFWNQTEAEREI